MIVFGDGAKEVRILVSDPISDPGLDVLRSTPGFRVDVRTGLSASELAEALPGYDGLVVRSGTRVTADVLERPGRLRIIGRAGTGVDNIDLDAATRAGVVVINTPGGNSAAAAEHTVALVLALARNIPFAHADVRSGGWNRKAFTGVEGARRALGLKMDVLAYDPFVSAESAAELGVETQPLDQVLERSDFLSLHRPLTDKTRHVIDARALQTMRPGSRLINCARGGLVDEAALIEALDGGRLAGAAMDVFEQEPPTDRPIVRHPRVVCTPHLGASTREAQERVGVEIAEKIRDFLVTGAILDAVNFPSVERERYPAIRPVLDLAERLGSFLAQTADGAARRLEVRSEGEFGEHPLRPIAMAAARGLLAPAVEGTVSYVNALHLASERGITVEETRSGEKSPWRGALRLHLESSEGRCTVTGSVIRNEPAIVEIDSVPIEARPRGHLLVLRNRDVPGVVGRVGTLLGDAGVNIGRINLGRDRDPDRAVSVIEIDQPAGQELLSALASIDTVLSVRGVEL